MEASVAARVIANAGELNGFLMPVSGIFAEPLPMEGGAIVLSPDFIPVLDTDKVAAFTVATERCGAAALAVGK